MSKVTNVLPMHQEGEADVPLTLALHIGKAAMSQAGLTAEQVQWMLEHRTSEILEYVALEERRQRSPYMTMLMNVLYIAGILLVLLLFLRLAWNCLSRMKTKKQQQ